jgi:hypothetical protein
MRSNKNEPYLQYANDIYSTPTRVNDNAICTFSRFNEKGMRNDQK